MQNCDYCGDPTERTVEAMGERVPVCPRCGVLLASPMTGPRLIRGHVTMKLRGRVGNAQLKKLLDQAMPFFDAMKRKNAS